MKLLLIVVCVSCVLVMSGAAQQAQWPMYQVDVESSGFAWRHSGPDDGVLVVTEGIIGVGWSSPVVVGPNGEIYIAGVDRQASSSARRYYVYSLRVSGAKEITVSWKRELRTRVDACPATNEFGDLLVLDIAGNVYAFDVKGDALWSPRNLMEYPGGSQTASAAIRYAVGDPGNAYIYVRNYGHAAALYKLDWHSGRTVWRTYELRSSWNRSTPFVLSYAELLTIWFAGYVDEELVLASVDPHTGEVLGTIYSPTLDDTWRMMCAQPWNTRAAAMILLGQSDRTVAVYAGRGSHLCSILWERSDVSSYHGMALDNNNVYIYLSNSRDVVSVDLWSGELERTFPIGYGLGPPAIIDGEQRLYFLTSSGLGEDERHLVCYNAWGTLRFDIVLPGKEPPWKAESMAMVVPDGFQGWYRHMEDGGLLSSHIIVPMDDGAMAVVFDRTR